MGLLDRIERAQRLEIKEENSKISETAKIDKKSEKSGENFADTHLPEAPAAAVYPAEPGQISRSTSKRDQVSDPEQLPPVADQKKRKRNQDRRDNFEAGLPWIMANLEKLVAAGWTRAEIFRMAKTTFPLGKWGLAWLGDWTRPGLVVTIHKSGRVIFTMKNNGRTISQSVSPSGISPTKHSSTATNRRKTKK